MNKRLGKRIHESEVEGAGVRNRSKREQNEGVNEVEVMSTKNYSGIERVGKQLCLGLGRMA